MGSKRLKLKENVEESVESMEIRCDKLYNWCMNEGLDNLIEFVDKSLECKRLFKAIRKLKGGE